MKIRLVILAMLFILTITANAQNTDRVITNNNDTIACEISKPHVFSAYKYTTTAGEKPIKITKDQIKEFYSGDKQLWYRKIFYGNSNVLFMRVLERGTISLYETFINVDQTTSLRWYVAKNNDTAVFIKTDRIAFLTGNQKGKKLLGQLLADNKSIFDQYTANEDLSIEEIRSLIQKYNTGVQQTSK